MAEASWDQLGYLATNASKNPDTAAAVVRWRRTSAMTCWYVPASFERQGKSLLFTLAQPLRSFASLVSLRFSPGVTGSGERVDFWWREKCAEVVRVNLEQVAVVTRARLGLLVERIVDGDDARFD